MDVGSESPNRISYAQNGEDVRVWRALRDVDEPFYVEVGASHPFEDSLTAALSAEGWRGILIEPDPASAEQLRAARPRDVVVAAAAHSRPGVVAWVDQGERGRGTVQAESAPVPEAAGLGTVSVPAVRLTDLLCDVRPENIHFLSIDVEGHEQHVLQGLDLQQWRPWVVCVEATEPGSRTTVHEAWEPGVLKTGYRFVTFDGLNRWYVAEEHDHLADVIAEPFSVLDTMLDGWLRYDVSALRDEVEDLRQRLDDRDTTIIDFETQRQADEARAADSMRRLDNAEHLAQSQRAEVDRLTAERSAEAQAHARALAELQREVELVAAQRDAAVARERVMLDSKSWRLTCPLRALRRNVTNAAAARNKRRAHLGASTPAPTPDEHYTPADLRRRRALVAKLYATRGRGGRA